MANYRRNFVPGGSFFFTVNLADRRSCLLTKRIEQLRTAFRYTRMRHPFTIDAIVVLPDHLHTIWTLPPGDADFATRWRLIKTPFPRVSRLESSAPQVEPLRMNAASGNDAIGSTRFETRTILSSIAITFITIQ
jgi:putative transposase